MESANKDSSLVTRSPGSKLMEETQTFKIVVELGSSHEVLKKVKCPLCDELFTITDVKVHVPGCNGVVTEKSQFLPSPPPQVSNIPLDSYLKYQTPVSVENMPANEYEYFSQFVMPIAIPLKAQYIYQDSKL